MNALLLKNIKTVYTFNDHEDIVAHADIYIEDGVIQSVGEWPAMPDPACTVIDCTGLIALPGFVNTHHHLYQTLFRGIPEVQEKPLFPWLKGLYQFWQFISEDAVYYGAMVGLSELQRTGCTCTADHHYVFPAGQPDTLIDAEIRAAEEIGIRFHATRGSMSLGVDDGGLPPMSVVQSEEAILSDSKRLIDLYHDKNPYAMTRIALAPCSPFSVTPELMKETAKLARKSGVMLHTHLAETLDEEAFCLNKFGLRPFAYMESLGWVGEDVWFAHGIHLSDDEISRLSGSGIAHCPSSNMKLGSGICRTSELFRQGARLGLAVDGSASNDGSSMLEEVRRMYLLNHLKYGSTGLSAYDCLKIATRGGADVLNRTDIGRLETGKAADIILFDLADIAFAGCHDPLVGLVSMGNTSFTKMTIVNGVVTSRDGQVTAIDTRAVGETAHALAASLVEKARKRYVERL